MNLIVTPVYKNFEVLKRCCEAIDQHSKMPFLHILVDDNSGSDLPIEVTKNRRIIRVFSDVPGVVHKNQLGQMIDLGGWYGSQKYWNEKEQEAIENLFIIESDVVVKEGWDEKMLEEAKKLPYGWITLDCSSVDEEGKVTYPDTVAPRWPEKFGEFEMLHSAMFQCTLFSGFSDRFSSVPSHFDILWSRAASNGTEKGFYRTLNVQALHINGGGSSRDLLPKE